MGLVVGSLGTTLLVLPVVLLGAWLLPVWARAVPLTVVLACVLADLSGLWTIRFPQNNRQVPQSIVHGSPEEGALLFGFEMGTGLRTFSPSGFPHLIVSSLVLVGEAWPVVIAGLGFGVGRAVMARGAAASPESWDAGWEGRRRVVLPVLLGACLLPIAAWVAVR